jgi:Uri superfamily endonuclease
MTSTVLLTNVIRGFGCSQWSECRFASPLFVVQTYGLLLRQTCSHARRVERTSYTS